MTEATPQRRKYVRKAPLKDNIVRNWPAFTVRLPPEMYERLTETAATNRRSRAAQVELDLQHLYGDKT